MPIEEALLSGVQIPQVKVPGVLYGPHRSVKQCRNLLTSWLDNVMRIERRDGFVFSEIGIASMYTTSSVL